MSNHINLQSKFQVQTYDNLELMRIIAMLVGELGGKFVFTRERVESLMDSKGELIWVNDPATMDITLVYKAPRIEPPDIGNTRQQ